MPRPPEGDNGQAIIDVEWTNPDTDWDVYVYDETGAQVGVGRDRRRPASAG